MSETNQRAKVRRASEFNLPFGSEAILRYAQPHPQFSRHICGAGVAGKALEQFHLKEPWLEFAVLIFATAQLTFDFGSKARTHEFLQRKYQEMLAEIEIEEKPNPAKWKSKLQTIAGEEPMPMRALDALAYNAAVDATSGEPTYRRENRLRVPFCHRLLRHMFAREGYEYRLESEPISGWQRFLDCFRS